MVQDAGFAGLIVWNTADGGNINTMSDDGTGRNIKIRSTMIPYDDGLVLFKHFKSFPKHDIRVKFGQCKNTFSYFA